ncbi:MAG TPA: amino acid adenylation domain-containing protein [Pseudonocardiaceae bacterium]|nr:amino acid adenylation domain-containing protein [Pseudonocardiaceae bacterium]
MAAPRRTPEGADRRFWRDVLAEGGGTSIPRWAPDPVPGLAGHEAPMPPDLAELVELFAAELAVPVSAVLLAAHAKVLAALCGDAEVVTGYATGCHVLPCRVATEAPTWRELVTHAAGVEAELLAHQHFPVDELAAELGLDRPYEAEFGWGEPTGALRVAITTEAVQLSYRTDTLNQGAAARIAGYHLAALRLATTDPDAEHGRQSLLSEQELGFQLDGLAGRHRELPDLRCHELFERRAYAHPGRVAAVHRGREWTYGELNARANRLARALLTRGLGPEDVVAVVTERNLDWLAAVLAVFKAGGVYLPIEPHFPADRIATTLSRAGCRFVVTEPESTATLDDAVRRLDGVTTLLVGVAEYEGLASGDLDVDVMPDQLAYIYFTSGSTGEPKGAMCEHAGLLNHLHAKIDDLEIGEGTVVAQTAPQCFDISLWQLVAPLLVGGRTLIVPQDVVLDVERFVGTLVAGHVSVLQVVPSYLEAVLSYVEQSPRELPHLRYVSVTGEACKPELARRWFTAQPGIGLVNAYGLTETSDDTNHQVMRSAPDRISLGRPVANVRVYVVDEHLMPVPLGAPGQIVFSGVCVGRGYVNDPERTKQAFLADPHRPGERLYQGGDFGRWLPDGTLEFLGRRDNQVKISGFRIEIGEIENTLLRVPGVRDGAVLVVGGKRLVACYAADAPLDAGLLRDRLGAALPAYMVPSAFHWYPSLPLTPNGKIARKALAAQVADTAEDGDAPCTPTERRLADAWATVLGVDRIGRRDNFFDRGGTSLSAVRLAITMRRAVSLKDVTSHPVLADLAAVMDGRSARPAGLLHRLSEGDSVCALVCFPYAGGNAVNFQPMAKAMQDSGIAVYAVELPGHDLAERREPFVPLEQVVDRVVREIADLGIGPVLLWGHSSGAAFALATAAELDRRGTPAQRVFLAAQLPGTAAGRLTSADELAAQTTTEIAAGLAGDRGYPALAELDDQRADHVGGAYRHDGVCAHRYLAAALADPEAAQVTAPLTVVVAADDPITAGFTDRHRAWQALAERVDLHTLPDGGHYFLRTRPTETAQVVLRSAGLLAPS